MFPVVSQSGVHIDSMHPFFAYPVVMFPVVSQSGVHIDFVHLFFARAIGHASKITVKVTFTVEVNFARPCL